LILLDKRFLGGMFFVKTELLFIEVMYKLSQLILLYESPC